MAVPYIGHRIDPVSNDRVLGALKRETLPALVRIHSGLDGADHLAVTDRR